MTSSADVTRIEVPYGSLIPALDIFGEPCFWAYDDRDHEAGCWRTRQAAEEKLLQLWHRWDWKGVR